MVAELERRADKCRLRCRDVGSFDDRVDDGAAFASLGIPEKEPVHFSESSRSNSIFDQVIVDFNLSVLKIDFQ